MLLIHFYDSRQIGQFESEERALLEQLTICHLALLSNITDDVASIRPPIIGGQLHISYACTEFQRVLGFGYTAPRGEIMGKMPISQDMVGEFVTWRINYHSGRLDWDRHDVVEYVSPDCKRIKIGQIWHRAEDVEILEVHDVVAAMETARELQRESEPPRQDVKECYFTLSLFQHCDGEIRMLMGRLAQYIDTGISNTEMKSRR